MKYPSGIALVPGALKRRKFVQGLAAGGVLLGVSALSAKGWAQEAQPTSRAAPVLEGNDFNLVISELPVNFTGNPRMATAINGSIPAPTLRWRQGQTVTIRVTNQLKEASSIHWHGIILPYQMDGVPGISFAGIPPGATFTYRFKVEQSGTYWYHSHSGMQEVTGMYGAIIVEPEGSDSIRAERDHVVLLSDWTDEDPARVFAKLKVQSNYYNHIQPTAFDFFHDASREGVKSAVDKRKMWNSMRMSPTDLADLSSDTLTFLTNGTTPAGNWTGLFRKGERVRLRFINGASNSFYDVRIPGLQLKVVQVDGVNVEAVTVDEFRFGPGETYDVLVEPRDDAYTIFAQSMDRSGYARGTLATRVGVQAQVPALDRVQWLTMDDMMGSMGGQGSMAGMDHSKMAMGSMAGMDHSKMAMGSMAGMDHSKMAMGSMAGMDHSKMAMPGMGGSPDLSVPSTQARHARTEYGPSTDMRVDMARTNLDDPGIGLRNNGRRVLTLADLHTIGGALDSRGPEREIEMHLTGNMERYSWSMDGLEFGQSTPVKFNYGERVRVILHNDTMMTHPMHMHGMWSELEAPDGTFQVRRHTIPVQPAQRISFLVTAEAMGRWAWHCHLMFHMDAGMFREVLVA